MLTEESFGQSQCNKTAVICIRRIYTLFSLQINYADGIADGREKVFQTSFDQGYVDGLRTGLELAKLSNFFGTLPTAGTDNALEKEYILYQQMKLEKATDKSHFKYLEYQTEPLSVVSDKQRTYIDDLLQRCSETLPVTTDLFKSRAD